MSIRRRSGLIGVVIVTLLVAGCATRTIPPAPVAIAHGEFIYPTVPPALKGQTGADLVDIGWRYLQGDNAVSAARNFEQALKRNPAMYPARAGLGYAALSRRDFTHALSSFDSVLKSAPTYEPALVGRGHTIIAIGRERDALTAF